MDNTNAKIPVIDISRSNPQAPEQLLSAVSKYGFVFVENNPEADIPPQDIANMFDLSKVFFASSTEIKQEVSIGSNEAGKNHGWLSQGIEKLDPKTQKRADVKEAFNMGPPLPDNTLDQPLPTPLSPHLDTLISFQHHCHTLCQLLFTHLATALQIPPDWFTSRHDQSQGPSGTVFRMLYYPAATATNNKIEDGSSDLRAGAHSDFGSLTLLFQLPGQPGLEIKTPEGTWASVPVDPSSSSSSNTTSGKALPILVNIGDLLEDWTAGLLKSTLHRVIFPTNSTESQDRYSLAYFCHPLDDALLEPVPSAIVRDHAASGKGNHGRRTVDGQAVMTAKDHLMERLGATYSVGK